MDFDVSMAWDVGTSTHYDQQAGEDYFDFQASIGEFGGWANVTKFSDYVAPGDTVLDFGCGGGYLLKNLPHFLGHSRVPLPISCCSLSCAGCLPIAYPLEILGRFDL